jgi:hypothetical protein
MNEYVDLEKGKGLGPLPEPPIEGTETIIPLRRGEELRDEGIEQHNCVGGFAGGVRAGRTYIYKIIAPERATLSIVQGSSGEWIISQLNATCNSPVKSETWQAVREWLSQTQVGI